MGTEKNRSDDELRNLYERRYEAGYYFFYSSLSQEDKKRYETISAEEDVKKWRKEGTLIDRISNFSREENIKYSPFIKLEERLKSALQLCIINNIVDLKCNRKRESDVKDEILRMTSEQKNAAKTFLTAELHNCRSKNYVSEINKIISWL